MALGSGAMPLKSKRKKISECENVFVWAQLSFKNAGLCLGFTLKLLYLCSVP